MRAVPSWELWALHEAPLVDILGPLSIKNLSVTRPVWRNILHLIVILLGLLVGGLLLLHIVRIKRGLLHGLISLCVWCKGLCEIRSGGLVLLLLVNNFTTMHHLLLWKWKIPVLLYLVFDEGAWCAHWEIAPWGKTVWVASRWSTSTELTSISEGVALLCSYLLKFELVDVKNSLVCISWANLWFKIPRSSHLALMICK